MKKIMIIVITVLSINLVFSQDFTFGTIPDTQSLTTNDADAARITEITQWYVDHRDSLNINFVASLGDMTEWGAIDQWIRVRESYDVFLNAGMPYAPCQGNHDPQLDRLNEYFPESEFDTMPTYGGNFRGMENAYYLFTEAGVDYIVVVVQTHDQFIGFYDLESVNWANDILDTYARRKAILVTHDFYENRGLINDIIKKHDNLFLALCGHSCAREQYWTETTNGGNTVHCIMADYQCDADKGATLRYYTFKPAEDKIYAYTYNVIKQEYEVDASSEFSFSTQLTVSEEPEILNVSNYPVYPKSVETAEISAIIFDNDTVTNAMLKWGINSGELNDSIQMSIDSIHYVGTISAYPTGTTIYYSIVAIDNNGLQSESIEYSYLVEDNESNLPCPYNPDQNAYKNNIVYLPGLVEAENFNEGCQNVAYSDIDGTNIGKIYRTTSAVDIERCNEGGFNVGWIASGEWLNYEVEVAETEEYSFYFRIASQSDGSQIHLEIDDVDISGPIELPATGGWQKWNTVAVHNIPLSAGIQNIKVVADDGEFNFNNFRTWITGAPQISEENAVASDEQSLYSISVSAVITDDVSIPTAIVFWGTESENLVNQIQMNATGNTYTCDIPVSSEGTTIYYKIQASDDDENISTTAEMNFEIEVVSSFKNINTDIKPIIFPNPADDELTIRWDESNYNLLQITDLTGTLFYSEVVAENTADHNISLNGFKKGIYLLVLSDEKSRDVMRLVKN